MLYEVITPIVSHSMPFYIGLGYSRINADGKGSSGFPNAVLVDATSSMDANNYLFLAGVKINKYLAIEGRYSNSFEDVKLKNNIIGTKVTLPDSERNNFV